MTEDPAVQIIATALAASWATDQAADVNVDAEAVAAALRAAGYPLNPDEVSVKPPASQGSVEGAPNGGERLPETIPADDEVSVPIEALWEDNAIQIKGEMGRRMIATRYGHEVLGALIEFGKTQGKPWENLSARLDPSTKETR